MFLAPAEQAEQIERFLARIPKGILHDVARSVAERLAEIFPGEAIRALASEFDARPPRRDNSGAREDAQRWRLDMAADVVRLRGFVLWTGAAPGAIVLVTAKSEKKALASCYSLAYVYFVDDDKKLWRLELRIDDDAVGVEGRPASAAELVKECQDSLYGPLSWGHSVMLHQFGRTAKAARERASRLERLIEHVEASTRLDEDCWRDYEYVIKWDGEPPVPQVVMDVRQHWARGTFLLRERNEGDEPHSVREFPTVADAIAEAGKHHGYLRRRGGGLP